MTEGVTVPPGLARPLARLASIGAEVLLNRDCLPVVPGLMRLIAELDAAASGRETPIGIVETVPITVREAAEIADVSEQRIRQLCASQRLIARRHGRTWLIDRASALTYGRERRHGTDDDP